MFIKSLSAVLIWSENWRDLANWYRDILELPVESELNLPNDTGINFKIGETWFWVGYHDQVHGKSKDMYRIMISFNVDSIKTTYQRLTAKGVKFILEPTKSPDGTFYVATALDPENNIIQFESDNE